MFFADRLDAGRRLATRLHHLRTEPVVVLACPAAACRWRMRWRGHSAPRSMCQANRGDGWCDRGDGAVGVQVGITRGCSRRARQLHGKAMSYCALFPLMSWGLEGERRSGRPRLLVACRDGRDMGSYSVLTCSIP
jgi:hypothetical protein